MSIKLVDTKDFRPAVAIVGAGASGTLLAMHLLRAGNVRVILIERGARAGRGVAYGTSFPGHLLNVPAASMSGLPDDPGHFLRFVRERHDEAAEPTMFVPRMVYGAYLESLLAESEGIAAPGASLERRRGEVVDVSGGLLTLTDGSRLRADHIVLALGNLPPPDPALPEGTWPGDPSRYVRDPWSPGALDHRAPGPVLLVGAGLTMVDVALQLAAREPEQRIVALSRSGLLPHVHRAGGAPPSSGVAVPDPTPSLPALLRFVRASAAVAEVGGGDWRDAVNALRPVTAELWAALPRAEQRRFLTRLARYWDVHRHRLAPGVATAVDELRRNGRLELTSGRMRSVTPEGAGLLVRVLERRSGSERSVRVSSIVNCTGPNGDVLGGGSSLLDALCASGAARPHPLALGLDTRADGAVRDAHGRASERLFAIGPLRRGELWESTAIPEIRRQAEALAQRLVSQRTLAYS
ncbi:MAG TPA: FAD/NAD(P)-binding protein [Gaiellales bacterium]|jgi:uncharacterized NAD(P)/FAD-binding protein YdhS|nr:FAD/NAD(P)-binding protein [Gaiellales bacterium]